MRPVRKFMICIGSLRNCYVTPCINPRNGLPIFAVASPVYQARNSIVAFGFADNGVHVESVRCEAKAYEEETYY
jgi:hypothetical protein